ncbi:hypothetical protein ACE1ET_17515 [Saccharicrinis sp. FJH62]|uniref:hypothetical protein n=1 Tax=Saccharicrinis sp. FJH62 TaxID=3344657 RepID=UPI0035D42FB9
MENLSTNEWKIFKGAGWLLGIVLSIVSALVVFTLSKNLAAAVSAALPIGVFAGISIEQKFQGENEAINPAKTNIMIGSLLLGFIIFVALYIILQLL